MRERGSERSGSPDPWRQLPRTIAAQRLRVAPDFEGRARLFLSELRRWNRVHRLTGYRGQAEQVQQLVVESLLWLPVLPEAPDPLLDVGTGPGVPGLVLKLARPEWGVALLEANRRRANFLRHVLRLLEIADVGVYPGRAEVLGESAELQGRFQTVTMRAVVPPEKAYAIAAPFLRVGGELVVSLGPRGIAGLGEQGRARVREVRGVAETTGLPWRRRFLIIRAVPGGNRRTFHVEH